MKNILRILILLIGIAFVVFGVQNKEDKRVMNKGNLVCLECIGIG